MRVLVDTSAWVDFLNGYPSKQAAAVTDLLQGEDDICTCGLVVTEVLQGLRRQSGFRDASALFKELTFLEPSGFAAYQRAAELYRRLREKGVTIRSTVDCVLAVVAEEAGCAILASDRDLEGLLASGLVKARAFSV